MSIFAKIRIFIETTMDEMKKSSWPDKDQLLQSTILVLVALVIVSAFVAGIDQVLFRVVDFLTTF